MAAPVHARKRKSTPRGGGSRYDGPDKRSRSADGDVVTIDTRLPLIVPDEMNCRLRYNNSRIVTTAFASQPFWWAFSANSVFDPDVSGVGGSCAGFTQLMAFYQNCVVTRVRARVQVASLQAATVGPTRFVLNANERGSVYTTSYSLSDVAEQPNSVMKIGGNSAGNRAVVVLERTWDVNKLFGISKRDLLANSTYYGTVSADPATEACIQFGAISMDGAAALNHIYDIEIEYEVKLFGRVAFT